MFNKGPPGTGAHIERGPKGGLERAYEAFGRGSEGLREDGHAAEARP